jgi:G3E family GTPase
MFAFQRAAPWGETEHRQSRIVFIGKTLRREILEKSLRQCYYKPEEYDDEA